MVQEITPTEYSSTDTFTFLQDLNKADIKDKFVVSFDVYSLFTNIPLNETIDLAIDRLFAKKPSLNATRKELRQLFEFCTSKTNFIFNGVIYDQIDGIAMGSPLAPVLANLLVHETKFLSEYEGEAPHFIEDTWTIFLLFSKMKNKGLHFSIILIVDTLA